MASSTAALSSAARSSLSLTAARCNPASTAQPLTSVVSISSAASPFTRRAALSLSRQSLLDRPLPVYSSQRSQGSCLRIVSASASAASDATSADSRAPESSQRVLVVGSTGGVGQLCVASLLAKGRPVRAVVRSVEKAQKLFSDAPGDLLQIVSADLRQPGTLTSAVLDGVGSAIVCVGTTAFPSKRWDGNNGPEMTDYVSIKNLVAALPRSLSRVVLVTSAGVERYNQLPYNILNLFGVLKYKKMSEDLLKASGLPYTILRPGRLTDGPYTSYDLNTLMKATVGRRLDARVLKGSDTLSGETSRVLLAECCVQALGVSEAENEVFEIMSVEGDGGPGSDESKWKKILVEAPTGGK